MYSSKDILWVRNVKKDGGTDIAYFEQEHENQFQLNWSSRYTDSNEASKPKVGDLILLFQSINEYKGVQLTHLVTPLDSKVTIGPNDAYKWCREVKVIARATNAHNPKPNGLNFMPVNQSHSYNIDTIGSDLSLEQLQDTIWNSFSGMFKENAAKIEEGIIDANIGHFEAPEGKETVAFKKHLLRERSSKLVDAKKRTAIINGSCRCECCNFDFHAFYGPLGEGFIECHHKIPINKGERITHTDDLALLCSNCHRMVHRTNEEGKYLSVIELQNILKERNSTT